MPATGELSAAEQASLRARCSVFLAGHGQVTAADLLASIPAGTVTDRYGEGGVVADLEAEIAGLLGKPAAVFVPSGTMAQQCVLRVHADRRQRMGGTLFGLWPNAASALTCLRRRLPLMPAYLSQARAIAAALGDLTGVRVMPSPPQVPMMHLLLGTTQDRFTAAARHMAAEQGIWTWPKAMTTIDPGIQRVELSVGDATCALEPDQVRDIIAALIGQ